MEGRKPVVLAGSHSSRGVIARHTSLDLGLVRLGRSPQTFGCRLEVWIPDLIDSNTLKPHIVGNG